MPQSGKTRKQKRRTRKRVEAQLPAHWIPTSKKEEQENNRLIQESLRWKTNLLGGNEFSISKQEANQLNIKELAVLIMRRNLLSGDPKISNLAAKNIIAMEGQNQKDQLKPEETTHQHVHIHGKQNLEQATNADILELMTIRHRLNQKNNG